METIKRIIREKKPLKIKNITARNFMGFLKIKDKGELKGISLRKYNEKT